MEFLPDSIQTWQMVKPWVHEKGTGSVGEGLIEKTEIPVPELQEGDVLVLNKKTSDPVGLIIEGKTRFLGHPAQSSGKLAVQITQSNTKTQ